MIKQEWYFELQFEMWLAGSPFTFQVVPDPNLGRVCCLRRLGWGWLRLKIPFWGFPVGTVVKNPPANAGDTGSSPGPGRSHMPWSN